MDDSTLGSGIPVSKPRLLERGGRHPRGTKSSGTLEPARGCQAPEHAGCGEREVKCIVVFVMVLVRNKGR